MTEFSGFGSAADDFEDFAAALRAAADRTPEAVDSGMEKTAFDTAADAAVRAPKKTGRLANSIEAEREALMRWVVYARTDYARHVEYGTSPRDRINAKPGGMLKFEWPDAPPEVAAQFPETFPTVFFKSAQPRGQAAQPYLRPALAAQRQPLLDNVSSEVEQVIAEELAAIRGY